jgi:hypothetical protein
MRNNYRAGIFLATGIALLATYGCTPDAPATPSPMPPGVHATGTPIPVVPVGTASPSPIMATPVSTPAAGISPAASPTPTKTP